MHIGSGDTTFGVIDNKVQRDVLTGYPTIHSSSLKGALREFFSGHNNNDIRNLVNYIFGSKPKDSNENQKQGNYRFFDANLLSYPVRSDKNLFYRATTVSIIQDFLDKFESFGTDFPIKEPLKKLLTITLLSCTDKEESLLL